MDRFARALDAGVPIYAGTDAGGFLPHGLVGNEIAALAQFSSAEYALGAGSWRARAWLGHPATLSEGAPADLVIFDADPRLDLSVLRAPRYVILRGALVD
jgi:imidazolonepropionase-like amidohydrolase